MKSLSYIVILAGLLLPGVILPKEVLQSGVNVSIHMFRTGKFIANDNMEVTQWSWCKCGDAPSRQYGLL